MERKDQAGYSRVIFRYKLGRPQPVEMDAHETRNKAGAKELIRILEVQASNSIEELAQLNIQGGHDSLQSPCPNFFVPVFQL